jgi:hypothetical protein
MDAMNDNTDGTRGSRRAWLLTCMVGVVLLMTACGASGGSSSTSTPAPAQTTRYEKTLAFSQCMRSHGVPEFPDPNANGAIALGSVAGQIKLDSSQVQSALVICRHLLPNGGTLNPAQQQKALNALLKFARCMRSHGVPNFPDPSLVNGNVTVDLQGAGISGASPHILTASRACQSALPSKAG